MDEEHGRKSEWVINNGFVLKARWKEKEGKVTQILAEKVHVNITEHLQEDIEKWRCIIRYLSYWKLN